MRVQSPPKKLVIIVAGLLILAGFVWMFLPSRPDLGFGSDFEPEYVEAVEKELGIKLPPDPGKEGMRTVEGIDSDADGIRDDIQLYIVLTYPDAKEKRAALTQAAKGMQALIKDHESAELSIQHSYEAKEGLDCMYYLFGVDEAIKQIDKIEAQLINTDERIRAYMRADAHLSGRAYGSPSQDDLIARCSNPANAMEY